MANEVYIVENSGQAKGFTCADGITIAKNTIMELKVKLSNLRTAPRKSRQVVDLVRGKKVLEAQSILLFTTNKSARHVLKLLNSAVAGAKNDLHIADESNLFISKITVDEGPKLKRWHPMSRGRAYPIIKRTSQIVVVLGEINPAKETKEEVKPVKKEIKKTRLAPKGRARLAQAKGRAAKKAK
jgi:large subunit ribosomal protein L22